jgi:hypothetical protein
MAIPTSGLICYIDFLNPACFTNGGTAVTDLSGSGNNFLFRNNTTTEALYTYDSTYGTITLATGPGNLSAVNQNFLNSNISFSLSWWMYIDSTGVASQYVLYVGGYPTNFISIDTRDLSFIRTSTVSGYIDTPANSLVLNDYNFICFTYDSSTDEVKTYINNNLENTTTANIDIDGSAGSYPGFMFNSYFTATGVNDLALFTVHNKVISTGERNDIFDVGYQRFNPPPPPGPILSSPGPIGGRRFGGRFNG